MSTEGEHTVFLFTGRYPTNVSEIFAHCTVKKNESDCTIQQGGRKFTFDQEVLYEESYKLDTNDYGDRIDPLSLYVGRIRNYRLPCAIRTDDFKILNN